MQTIHTKTNDLSIHKEFVYEQGDTEGYLALYFKFWHKGLSCTLFTEPRSRVRHLLPKYEALIADPLVEDLELCWENLWNHRETMFYPQNADYLS